MTTSPLLPRHEVTRRDALKLLAAGIAALEAGCLSRAGDEDIVPYVADPPEHRPGVIVRYTSLLVHGGFGYGIVVDTRDGRPIKIDGNPAHPATAGGSTPWMQARILDLYDPQRGRGARMAGSPATWSAIARRLRELPPGPVWLVLPPHSSPTLAHLLERLARQRELHVVTDAPLDHRARYRGAAAVYGEPLEQQLDLARADVLVALDADVLAQPAWARAAAARRAPGTRMSRIWACEPMQTPTGTLADEHLLVHAGEVAAIAAALAAELGLAVPHAPHAWARRLADDLRRHRGRAAIVVGDRQPPVVHALARWIDHALGNVGGPVTLTRPALVDPLAGETLADLAAAAPRAVAVIVVDANPVYTAPRALDLARALAAAPFSLHAGTYADQTALACFAHVPLAHELETWTDARARDGTLAVGQPLVRPRFDVASAIDVVAALLDDRGDARALVRERFVDDAAWTTALRTGAVAGSQAPAVAAAPHWTPEAFAAPTGGGIEIALAESPQIGDGRFAGNAWLQELPHPITKQTWGNAALMSPATALALGVSDEDLVELTTPAGTLVVPALIAPVAGGTITVELGHGQIVPEVPIADRIGGDAYALRGPDGSCILRGSAKKVRGTRRLARTQTTLGEHGREVAPAAPVAHWLANPGLVAHLRGDQPSLLPPQNRDGVQWAMMIDTSICTGCSACMVACQAENNIPTVGPVEVARGRHMNWLRIDRYERDDATVVNEPMPCQMCEYAPCEYVCPVMATQHSPDGLNEQVYNRCIGTRFCSNNCPYKVRRFNWFGFEDTSSRALQYNPDVTVRSRGVMEKCTYCVQRIRRAEQRALVEKRAIAPGEVVTACQAACPTGAIQFGQLAERDTAFARMRSDGRRFEVLHELGTRPRTQYLAKITNPKESK